MKLLMTCLTILSLVSLSACNTVKGIGQDLQKAGSSIENAGKK